MYIYFANFSLMVVTSKLDSYRKKDGTSCIFIYLYDKRTRERVEISTEHYVNPSDWTGSEVNKSHSGSSFINARLAEIKNDINRHWLKNDHLTVYDIKDWFLGPKQQIRYTPITYFFHYLELMEHGGVLHKTTKKKLSPGYVRAARVSYKAFEKFNKTKRVTFENISEEIYDQFVNYMRGTLHYSQNTIGKAIKHFKQAMAHAMKKGHHTNLQYRDYSISREKSQKIKLTPAEVQAIIDLKLTENPELKPEQERFEVAYNLLLRFGDTIAISEKNIILKDGRYFLNTVTEKTKKEILLPLKKRTYEILKRNKFKLQGTNAESNERLKKLGMMAKINSKVTRTEWANGEKVDNVYSKYQLIETHTTRRSAARNLYDAGMPVHIIMTLGGWKTEKQVLEYIDIDLDYAASKAVEHKFFD